MNTCNDNVYDIEEFEYRFHPCDYCDNQDACADFGCAIASGICDLPSPVW